MVVIVVSDIASCAGGLGFDSWAGQVGNSVNGSPPLQRYFEALLPNALRR